ncbi:YbjN domain-containing protein [Tessaracoccus sp. OH4464_COT-324]|uniref:T3SS (YopN, CesT) and YbjN peptide-binding chaperone 1 n=1 Tax=Tessaracoccus sp. OH4464_COT-324 TaxID=2491059 RepID=UPI000F63D7CB|nr:YbjN domain-containing protein [Tessaracoccus sp. OH4464_COT-324]RRD47468.1 hypothetical protein EII42_02440 [Tessaracoccus sp. OH4464_COT-324]
MDLENFDIDSATSSAWMQFTANLAEVLSVMDQSSDLTISVARGLVSGEVPAIRFSAADQRVSAHVVSGLTAPGTTDPAQDELPLLAKLGWTVRDDGDIVAECDQEETGFLAVLTTATMRQVFDVIHPVFLEPDHLKEVLSGFVSWHTPEQLRPEEVAVMPKGRRELDELIDAHLERLFRHPALRDPEGDVAIRVGSTMVFLRSTPDAAEVVLFSPLVHDVSGRSRTCEVLNDLNVESRYGRFALHRDRVYVQLSVPAKPFVPAHMDFALKIIAQIADGIDDDLAAKLGGRTTFGPS